jgi:hypothetical protein
VTKKKPDTRSSGWVQVVVSLDIIAAATAGTGQHNGVPSPRPLTGCVQLRVLASVSMVAPLSNELAQRLGARSGLRAAS